MSKYIKDSIYSEYLKFSQNELQFIDNSAFKRLKNIKFQIFSNFVFYIKY